MSHKHHSCSCNHENVKYCSTCRVVHCLDCNQEWTAKQSYTWYYNTPTYSNSIPGGGQSPNTWKDRVSDQYTLDIKCASATCGHE